MQGELQLHVPKYLNIHALIVSIMIAIQYEGSKVYYLVT